MASPPLCLNCGVAPSRPPHLYCRKACGVAFEARVANDPQQHHLQQQQYQFNQMQYQQQHQQQQQQQLHQQQQQLQHWQQQQQQHQQQRVSHDQHHAQQVHAQQLQQQARAHKKAQQFAGSVVAAAGPTPPPRPIAMASPGGFTTNDPDDHRRNAKSEPVWPQRNGDGRGRSGAASGSGSGGANSTSGSGGHATVAQSTPIAQQTAGAKGTPAVTNAPATVATAPAIHFYESDAPFYEFTNFYAAPIILDGVDYPTTEHYFQAQKFVPANTPLAEQVRSLARPRDAFDFARQKKAFVRGDWHSAVSVPKLCGLSEPVLVKDHVMLLAVRAKFTQHADLQQTLLSTNNAVLVERTKNDAYWGDGGNGSGCNRLGQILMLVRTELQLIKQPSAARPPAPGSELQFSAKRIVYDAITSRVPSLASMKAYAAASRAKVVGAAVVVVAFWGWQYRGWFS